MMAHSVKVELTPVVEALVYIDGIETVDFVLVVVKWVLMYLKVSFNTECFETGRTG
jgi:hypothetical protein